MSVASLSIQLTAVDMLSGVVSRAKQSVLNLGKSGRKVKNDFELMEQSIGKGLKAIAVSAFAIKKMLPGVKASADLQESMLAVKMNLAGSAENAKTLTDQLAAIKNTAVVVSADAPFSAEDVVKIQNSLLKAGLKLEDITGKSGAAFAATALAALTGEAPEMIGDALANLGAQFNLKGEQYKSSSDWMVRMSTASATNVPKLLLGLKMAGSEANNLGISLNDTITTLGVLAPLGERAGSSLAGFFRGAVGNTPEARKMMKKYKLNFFDKGQFVGMEKAIDILREKIGGINDDQERSRVLQKLFGDEGKRAASMFISSEKGFKEITKEAENAASMAERMLIWAEGMNAALAKLGGTAKSTLGAIFDPLLDPLTRVVNLLNVGTAKLGEFAAKHKTLNSLAIGGVAATALGAGAYGAYNLIRGGAAGSRVLKGIGGFKGLFKGVGGTGAGIAKGKAIQAATGVPPVFVTNWPDNFGASPAVAAAEVAKKSGAGILASFAQSIKSIGLLKSAGGVALAGAGGYAIGTGLNELINMGTGKLTGGKNESLGSWIYDLLQPKENDAEKKYKAAMAERVIREKAADVKNNIILNVTIDKNDRVVSEGSDMNTSTDINVNTGQF